MWVAVGESHKDTKWKNIQTNWKDLIERLKKPKRTGETVKEYHSKSKDERAVIKDIGGYVGGTIKGGNRKKKNIECRTLLTLEGDEDCAGLWEKFCLLYDYAGVLHSTHSSTKEHLRARLIIPLDRECFIDEYEAVVRLIAYELGMSFFDPTAFQPERLMYWPSIPKDATYIFEEQEGPVLGVDSVLSQYKDWKDQSQWPLHPKENKALKESADKQGNPLEKEGIIGAFCRAYDIYSTIEKFLPDIYEATDIDNRYTFKAGSTSGGLVVYEDVFAYSHHSTDPINGHLCNAFDLVRLSLFSDLDEGAEEITITKKPSFIKCCEFLLKDKKVKKAVVSEKLKEAQTEFAGLTGKEINLEEEDVTKEEWYEQLETDKKGRVIYSTVNNIVLILQNDKRFKDLFKWDSFNHRIIVAANTYWKTIKLPSDIWLNDNDKANIRHYLEKMYGISGKDKINDALLIVSYQNKFHPVLDYLEPLEWDCVDRLDTLLIDYLGAEDNEYIRVVTRKTLTAAIARIYEPGCKFDNVLVLVGVQGMGKSTLLDKLGGAWFSDNMGSLHTKESMEQLRGVWLMEIAELTAMKKADIDTVKSFVARRVDKFRQAFGETLSDFPRQCIFIGTTNEDEFLIDSTGNRRFWPVVLYANKANKNVFKLSEKEVKQIWAEAVYRYKAGETLYLDKDINEIAKKVQEQHTEKESYLQIIQSYLNTPIPESWEELSPSDKYSYLQSGSVDFTEAKEQTLIQRYKITALEIWEEALRGRRENFKKHEVKNIKNAMRKLKEWEYKKIRFSGLSVWGWMKDTEFIKSNTNAKGQKSSKNDVPKNEN